MTKQPSVSESAASRRRTWATVFARTAPRLPGSLVTWEGRQRLHRVASQLPAPLSRRTYFECRLGPGDARTDLILGLEDAGFDILTGVNPAIRLSPKLVEDPVWRGVTQLLAGLPPEARGLIRRVWLEFDLAADDELPIPGIFVDWQRPLGRGDALQAVSPWLRGFEEHFAPGEDTSALHGLRGAIETAIDRLPEGASLFSVGYFPKRNPSALRLCVRGLPWAEMPGYLTDMGWSDDPKPLFDWLVPPPSTPNGGDPLANTRILHMDLQEERMLRAGVEVAMRVEGRDGDRMKANQHLERLVQLGLCTPWKRRGLAEWPGGQIETLPHQLWPSRVARWVNHLKVSTRPGERPEAKAYLCQGHLPVERRRQSPSPFR